MAIHIFEQHGVELTRTWCLQVGPNQSELTGYNAKRHEFDPEFDQDAELLIAELEFREEDTPVCTAHPVQTQYGSTSVYCCLRHGNMLLYPLNGVHFMQGCLHK